MPRRSWHPCPRTHSTCSTAEPANPDVLRQPVPLGGVRCTISIPWCSQSAALHPAARCWHMSGGFSDWEAGWTAYTHLNLLPTHIYCHKLMPLLIAAIAQSVAVYCCSYVVPAIVALTHSHSLVVPVVLVEGAHASLPIPSPGRSDRIRLDTCDPP
jgi:hypothetical protein